MTDEELIARLRDACRGGDECKCSLSEAADRIEALTAERDCFKQRLQEEMALYAATSAERDALKAASVEMIADEILALDTDAQAALDRYVKEAVLSDPRVKALVEAVRELFDAENWRPGKKFDPGSGSFDLSRPRAALRAIGGE